MHLGPDHKYMYTQTTTNNDSDMPNGALLIEHSLFTTRLR